MVLALVPDHLLDVNVWLALSLRTHQHYEPSARWMASVDQPNSVFFCRATQQGFVRLVTTAATMSAYDGSPPLGNREAWEALDRLLSDDRIGWRDEPPGLEPRWRQYSARASASPKLWMDAYLAAFAMAGRLTFVTTDTAFRQFDGLDLLVLGTR